ncbi:MAG: hypothetical protein Ct9H300mP23_11000 [Nitrospinota bacterium]|nr:MAG: hypothetical protein Ct9H300mP23_11000 [Nitrospinota bacterium]
MSFWTGHCELNNLDVPVSFAQGKKLPKIKQKCGEHFKVVVPGIRPEWSQISSDDQNRISTPKKAIKEGADLIVVGPPIRDADAPKEAAGKLFQRLIPLSIHNKFSPIKFKIPI